MRGLPGDSESGENPIMPNLWVKRTAEPRVSFNSVLQNAASYRPPAAAYPGVGAACGVALSGPCPGGLHLRLRQPGHWTTIARGWPGPSALPSLGQRVNAAFMPGKTD